MGFINKEKIPYPKSVFFIISNEFCERFSYYGMRTILSLYLKNILHFNEKDSKIIYHTFTMLVYFFPIFGAIISDSFLGKFRTILYVSMIYSCGNVVLALASAEPVGLPQIPFTMVGLVLIALGTGGIKPCVSAFGGDQFTIPQQARQLAAFFSMFYFAINAGSLISTFLTPVLREDVHCFGEESCYPLAFAVPGVLMLVSIIIFGSGRSLYKIKKPQGNIVVKVSKCMGHAISQKFKSKSEVDHWLDRSEDKFGSKLVNDIKSTLKVLVIFVPLPIFWALYDQQGSGWTFQATRMDGDIGIYTILPDQMQVINPLLILAFIPLFTYFIYPALAKCNLLKTPLQKMVCGGLITAISFGISAGVSFALEATEPTLPSSGQVQLRIYNPNNCQARINSVEYLADVKIEPMSYFYTNLENVENERNITYSITSCDGTSRNSELKIDGGKSFFYSVVSGMLTGGEDSIERDDDGLPKIRTLTSNPNFEFNLTYVSGGTKLGVPIKSSNIFTTTPGVYQLEGNNKELGFYLGGVYTTLVLLDNLGKIEKIELLEITQPNSVHILWLIPQYVVITAGEIMFSITGLEFSYSQAPSSMKSVLTACFLLTTAFGNLIIVIIESAKIFDRQSYDFLLYTGLMVIDMIIFAFMAMRYKYVQVEASETEIEELDETLAIDNAGFVKNDDKLTVKEK